MAEARDYFLTEDELKRLFEEEVLDYVFGRYQPQRRPVLVLVGAQQAAGKSYAIKKARERHADSQLVPLTGDALRFLHPDHDALMENEPWLFLEATGQATAHWVKWSIEHARKENYSLILEGVFRDPEMPHATAKEFATGHTVEVVGLAVREEVSRLDGEYRFLEGGRWTPPELHDLSYRMMPETIRALAGSPAVHRVTITDRTGDDLHVLDKTAGRTAGHPADEAATALEDLRSRPLSPETAQAWMARQRETVITYAARDAINDRSRPTLVRITGQDATRIMSMAVPRSTEDLRSAYESAQLLLRALVDEPLEPNLPLRLQTEQELSTLLTLDGQPQQRQEVSVELARRAALTPVQRNAENLVQQQLSAARSPLTDEAAGRRDTDSVIDPDVQAVLDTMGRSHPREAGSISRPATSAKPPTERPMRATPDPAAELD